MLTVGRKIACSGVDLKRKMESAAADSIYVLNRTDLAGYGAQFARQKVVGRPWATDRKFHIFKLFGGCSVAVLVFLDRRVIDEVGDIDHHATGLDLLAADLGIEGQEQLLHLDGEG